MPAYQKCKTSLHLTLVKNGITKRSQMRGSNKLSRRMWWGPNKAPSNNSRLHMGFSIKISMRIPIMVHTVLVTPAPITVMVRTISPWMGATISFSIRTPLMWVIVTTMGLWHKSTPLSTLRMDTSVRMISRRRVIRRHFHYWALRSCRLREASIGRTTPSTAVTALHRFLACG